MYGPLWNIFLQNQYKPTNLETLQDGIKEFWKSMTPTACAKYIHVSHLWKVIPKVIEVNGAATGF